MAQSSAPRRYNTLLDAPLEVKGGSGSGNGIVVTCPNCKGFLEGKGRQHITKFTMTDGTAHAAPDFWLACRGERYMREDGLDPVEAGFWALADFAFGCQLAIRAGVA